MAHLMMEDLLNAGERLVLFGPNGAGKSTWLRDLARRPDAAYLPQRPYMFRGSAGWNLFLGLDREAAARAAQLAGAFGVGQRLDASGRRLSGGERARLALARVLARPEPLLLLDEPLASMDVRDRPAIIAALRAGIGDRSAVVVTHDAADAAALADRLAIMIDRRIRQVGPVQEVLTLPADEDVAGVIGVGNALDGRSVGSEDELTTVVVGDIQVTGVGSVAVGGLARVFFPAEAVAVSTEPAPTSARNRWSGRIGELRQAGRLVEAIVEVGVPIAALLTPGAVDALALEPGMEVEVSVKATALRVVPR